MSGKKNGVYITTTLLRILMYIYVFLVAAQFCDTREHAI